MRSGLGSGLSRGSRNWDPRSLVGCVLFLTADVGVGTSGSAVTSWSDLSGQGNHVTQSNPTYQPTYVSGSRPYVLSSHTSLLKSAAAISGLVQPFTVIAVVNSSGAGTGNNAVIDFGTNVCELCQSVSANTMTTYDGAFGGTAAISLNTPFMATAVWNGASSSLAINNGTPVTGNSGATNPSGAFTVGNAGNGASFANGWQGPMYSIVVVNRLLTSVENAMFHAWAQGRWGTA